MYNSKEKRHMKNSLRQYLQAEFSGSFTFTHCKHSMQQYSCTFLSKIICKKKRNKNMIHKECATMRNKNNVLGITVLFLEDSTGFGKVGEAKLNRMIVHI